jgi:hypothetical protein
MNIRGNQKWKTQRNWQHREHKTKKSKTKTQHNTQTNTQTRHDTPHNQQEAE